MQERSYIVQIGSRRISVKMAREGSGWRFEVDGKRHAVERVQAAGTGAMHLLIDGKGRELFLRRNGTRSYRVLSGTRERKVEVHDPVAFRFMTEGRAADAAAEETIRAPIPGSILRVFVKPGDRVKIDQPLVILEAMKMQNEILSPTGGLVTAVHVEQGQTVPGDAPMIVLSTGPERPS